MSTSPRGKQDQATVNDRIAWLLKTRFDDNRSAMAKVIGFSHTAIANIVTGEPPQLPGHRLLQAIVNRLGVNSAWLRTGKGKPFQRDPDTHAGIPVTNILLPGPPLQHQSLITGDTIVVPEIASSPGMYWLVLKSSQPLVQKASSGFRVGDHLLMETDPARFPKENELRDDLCVVKGGKDGLDMRLGTVRHYPAGMDNGDARLELDLPRPGKGGNEVVERVYRHYPDGEIQVAERRLPMADRRVNDLSPNVILLTDIVAVWLKILRRPFG